MEKESNLNPLKLRIDRVESIGKNNVENWVTYKNKILSTANKPDKINSFSPNGINFQKVILSKNPIIKLVIMTAGCGGMKAGM